VRTVRAWRLRQKVLFVVTGGLVVGLLGGFIFGLAIGDTTGQLGFDALFVGVLLSPLIMLAIGLSVWVMGVVARLKEGRHETGAPGDDPNA
jgi:hypothetical protein